MNPEPLTQQTVPPEYADSVWSRDVGDRLPDDWHTLLLIGPAGTGKTTQLWGLHRAQPCGRVYDGMHPVHVASECSDIDRHRYDWEQLDRLAHFRGALCIDDLGYRRPTDWTIAAVYHLATYRRSHRLKTIWTSNLSHERIAEWYGEPIASRIAGGIVITTGGPDRRMAYAGRIAVKSAETAPGGYHG